jgi:D-alanine transaminase
VQIAMINDKIIPFEKLDLVYHDRGLYFGDGVYEVLRSYNGKLFALEEHLERFKKSLEAIEITGVRIDDIKQKIIKAFETAGFSNAKIYLHITRGSAPRNHIWSNDIKPNFFLTVNSLTDHPEDNTKGISVCSYPDQRWKRCDIKSLNLLPNVQARQYAAKKGCEEAILVDDDGLITEGAASAFFAIFGNTLQTAPLKANILPSVTRKYVIKASNKIKMNILEQSLTLDAAKHADELFTAVTTKDIIAVTKFDEVIIGNGTMGTYTRKLKEEFQIFTK